MIDYTSIECDDLMAYAESNGQLDYVREDLQGNTQYYTKTNGNSFDTALDIYFCEARFYDAKRCPESCWGCFDWKRKSS